MSDLQTIQHLLRHLNNFPKLRRNALVASLRARSGLAGHALHARVREIVAESLRATVRLHSIEHGVERAARWQTIVQRCDLNGERHDDVAADLGISRRYFYKERRAAQESLASVLMDAFGLALQPARVIPSDLELQIETAISLRMRGQPEQTLPILERIAAGDGDPSHRLAAMTELSEAYEALGRTAELSALLDAARRLAYDEGHANPALETETLMIEASLTRGRGLSASYLAALERVHRRLARTDASLDARASELAPRTALLIAREYHYIGNAQGMQAYLASARELFERIRTPRPDLYAGYLILDAELAALRGDLQSAIQLQCECLAFSRSHGLPAHTYVALHNLSISYAHARHYDIARTCAHNALAIHELSGEPHSLETEGQLSYIEILTGRPHEALAIIRDARRRFQSPGGFGCNLALAEALECAGRAHDALDVLRSLSTNVEHRGWLRFLGSVERVRAAAYLDLDCRNQAHSAVDNAVQLVERHGSIHELARVYELSDRIGSNPIHRRRAREIRAQLIYKDVLDCPPPPL